MSVSPAVRAASSTPRLDVSRTLKPVIRSIGIARVARGLVLGFTLGALVGTGVPVAGHIYAFAAAHPIALTCLILGALAGVVWGIVRWPREAEAARTADLFFALDDRLTTAVELRGSDAPVAVVQSRDTAKRIEGLPLGRSRGTVLRRREMLLAAAATLAFAGSLVLGPRAETRHTIHRTTQAVTTRQVRKSAAKAIQKLQSQMRLGLTRGQQQTLAMRKINLALTRLKRQLLKSASTRTALRALSATQQQLRHLAVSLHPVNSHAVAQLNGSLSHYLSKRPGGTKSTRSASARSATATAQALNRLAQSLSHLNATQRTALARALARAANATSNTGLRSLLRQAASALANRNARAAAAALQRAGQSLSRSAGARVAQRQALSTASRLGSVKSQLSNAGRALSPGQAQQAGRQGNPSQSRSGSHGNQGAQGTQAAQGKSGRNGRLGLAPGKGQGKGTGQGTRPGQGNRPGAAGRVGRGNGRGVGAGQGRQASARSGSGTSGAHGNGGRGGRAATRGGHTETVYVPGKQGKGREIVKNGPKGAPQAGALVPYQQVLGQYTQQAHQALDRGSLPPSVQSYVHRYFSTISH
jgi:hypothetical protein